MSTRWPGGLIKPITPVPTGNTSDSIASGLWTLDQQAYWRSQNLWPDPNVNPSLYIENLFQTFLYTGNGSTQTIANGVDLANKGGLTWIKSRSATTDHFLFDTNRGALNEINSNTTDIQTSLAGSLTAFNSNGFSIGSAAGINVNAATYCSWTFRKQAKFFDVVTYTGNGVSGRTIAHSLGSVPGMIIVKNLAPFSENWPVWHRRSATFGDYNLLNSTVNNINDSTVFTTTAPTSSVFSVGANRATNFSGDTYVAYLFAHNAGGFGATGTENVITCDSFTKNFGSTVNVNLGYEPQYIMIKYLQSNQDWQVYDVMRGLSDTTSNQRLVPNTNAAEDSATVVTPTATGFIMAAALSGGGYMYMAIRRGPMQVPTLGTSVFYSEAVAQTNIQETANVPFPPDLAHSFSTNGSDRTTAFQLNLFTDRLRSLGIPNNTYANSGIGLVTSSANAELSAASTYIQLKADSRNITRGSGWNGTGEGNFIYNFFRRAPGFFDVVGYTGTGSATTVAHNLTVVPELMIVKSRSTAELWAVYSSGTGNANFLRLNTNAAIQSSATMWNSTTPTSSVFSTANNTINASGVTHVAYLFATCPGVSKVGSYTGTGTTQTLNCGFTAGSRFVLIKRTDDVGDWYVWDSARGIVAGNDPYLLLNSTAAEVTNTDYVDTAVTGFEISSTAPAAINANGGTYIFLAIA